MKINAYAKINLTLRVLGLREDGFHDLETRMQAISLHDDVFVDWDEGGEFVIRLRARMKNGEKTWLPQDERNLAWKAAKLARERLKPTLNGTLRIDIRKRIPVAAGLAGGSSNAAAVLTALQTLWKLPQEALLPLAAELGSDVPFSFLAQNGLTAAVGTGRGTELMPAQPVDQKIVLYNPGFGVSTPAVYRTWDRLYAEGKLKSSAPAIPSSDGNAATSYGNDLQTPALFLEPRIQNGLDLLGSLDPKPLHVQLSGSGPTVFALYPQNTDTETLKKSLQEAAPRAIIVEPLR